MSNPRDSVSPSITPLSNASRRLPISRPMRSEFSSPDEKSENPVQSTSRAIWRQLEDIDSMDSVRRVLFSPPPQSSLLTERDKRISRTVPKMVTYYANLVERKPTPVEAREFWKSVEHYWMEDARNENLQLYTLAPGANTAEPLESMETWSDQENSESTSELSGSGADQVLERPGLCMSKKRIYGFGTIQPGLMDTQVKRACYSTTLSQQTSPTPSCCASSTSTLSESKLKEASKTGSLLRSASPLTRSLKRCFRSVKTPPPS